MTIRERLAYLLLRRSELTVDLEENSILQADQIHFRPIEGPTRIDFRAQTRWMVEFYKGSFPAPVGIAWVTHDPSMKAKGAWDSTALLEFVLVADQHRETGIASRLVQACLERWPDLDLGAAISEEGDALLASVRRDSR